MKQHLFGFVGLSLAVALAAGCKSNPQGPIQGVPAAINVTSSFLVIDVGDSARVDAQVVDAQGTPLTTLPDASSNDPGVVSLSTIDPYPVPETSFWVKGETFGAGSISVTSGSLSATITVQTYPKAARVGNPPADTIMSGTPVPIAARTRPGAISASDASSIAVKPGWRPAALMPMSATSRRCVSRRNTVAGTTASWAQMCSAYQTPSKPYSSAARTAFRSL